MNRRKLYCFHQCRRDALPYAIGGRWHHRVAPKIATERCITRFSKNLKWFKQPSDSPSDTASDSTDSPSDSPSDSLSDSPSDSPNDSPWISYTCWPVPLVRGSGGTKDSAAATQGQRRSGASLVEGRIVVDSNGTFLGLLNLLNGQLIYGLWIKHFHSPVIDGLWILMNLANGLWISDYDWFSYVWISSFRNVVDQVFPSVSSTSPRE